MPEWLSWVMLAVLAIVVYGFIEWIGVKLVKKLWADESGASDTPLVLGWESAGYVAAALIIGGVGLSTEMDYVIWAIVPMVVMFYVSVFRANRRSKRKNLGLCLKCGYDLRASKATCPECGTEFPN